MGEHWEPAPSKGQVKRGDMLVTSKEGRVYMFPAQELHVPKPREATDLKMPFAMADVYSTRGRGTENGFREAGVGESLFS